MSGGEWRQSLEVARWEFRRFVKPKQLLASLVLMLLAGGIGYGLARLAARSGRAEATIAVIGGDTLGLAAASGDGITFVPHPPGARDSLRAAVGARTLDALLVLSGTDAAELVVSREPVWRDRLEARLGAARRQVKLRETGLPPARLIEILAPVRVDVRFHEAARGGRGARWAAIIAGAVVLYGVFIAAAYVFVSVTGEKQLRVTEQVLSIIRPQAWIDGKILGLAGVALVSVLTMAIGVLLFLAGRALAGGRWRLPSVAGDPGILALILIFALLGFLFWLAFLGAVAATIDDPNTSTRAPIVLLPAFFSISAFAILRAPDSAFARTVAILPVTSPAAMPARLALTDVAAWEIMLSVLVLAAAAWVMRSAAGRIFAAGMLLYGKEASWREIAGWVRKT